MAIQLKPTDRKYKYKGYQCTIYSLPDLGENFDLLLAESVAHSKKLGKKDIIFLEMSDIPFKLPSDFATCDKSEPDCFVIIIDSKDAYPFYLAHELVHLLHVFYDIDQWRLLKVAGKPIEYWPLFAKCIRRIEHFLSDIHIDAEVIRRGFSIEDHFLEQLKLALPVFTYNGENAVDFYYKLSLAANYLQLKYQLDAALRHGLICHSFEEELNKTEEAMKVKWPISFRMVFLMNKLIEKEDFLQGFDRPKFTRIGEKTGVMLTLFGVPGPPVNFE